MNEIEELFQLADNSPQRVQWREHRQRAVRYLTPLDTRPIVEALSRAWQRAIGDGSPLPTASELPEEVTIDLPRELIHAVDEQPTGDRRIDIAGQIVRGLAAARCILLLGPGASLYALRDIVDRCDFDALLGEFRDGIEASARGAWIKCLRPPEDPADYVFDDDGDRHTGFLHEAHQWTEARRRPFPKWRRNTFRPHGHASPPLLQLDLLHAIDEAEWLDSVDRLPLPQLAEGLLRTRLENDLGSLERLLHAAPVLLTVDGDATGSIAAMVLARLGFELGIDLQERIRIRAATGSVHRDDTPDSARVNDVLAGWYVHWGNAVLARDDGLPLLIEVGADFTMRAAQRRSWSAERAVAAEKIADKISSVLAAVPNAVREVEDRWRESEGGGRGDLRTDGLPYWLLGAAVANDAGAAQESPRLFEEKLAEDLTTWLGELLERCDPAVATIEEQLVPVWVYALCGLTLVSTRKPQAVWRALWERLEVPRYAAAVTATGSHPGLSPSRFLVRVGLYALPFITEMHLSASDRPIILWPALYTASLQLWLRHPSRDAHAMVVLAMVFLAKLDEREYLVRLRDFVRYLPGEPGVTAELATLLHKNDLSLNLLDEALRSSGIDLLDQMEAAPILRQVDSDEALDAALSALRELRLLQARED